MSHSHKKGDVIAEKKVIFLILFIMFGVAPLNLSFAQTSPKLKGTASANPIGSGARALGMGGAFIAVADDATSASWNPGGLVQLKKLEISFVANGFHRIEDNETSSPESSGSQNVSKTDINYFSLAYPFRLFNRNMIVSLNYQNLYDFASEWNLPFKKTHNETNTEENLNYHYQQEGNLSALGLAYCIQVIPDRLNFGFTLNLWEYGLSDNSWSEHHTILGPPVEWVERNTRLIELGIIKKPHNYHIILNSDTKNEYLFSGFNYNIGALWRITDKLTIGLVFKSPFTADLEHEVTWTRYHKSGDSKSEIMLEKTISNGKLDLPMSYGIGFAYRFSDAFTLSADIYRTEWQDYIITDSNGNKMSPVTGKPASESDIDPTTQIRLGTEYLFINPGSDYDYALRGGIFYDPPPAEGSPDDYYGFSLGSGVGIKTSGKLIKKYIFDVAYQYRLGKDVESSKLQNYDFSQDVHEHMVYASLIVHF